MFFKSSYSLRSICVTFTSDSLLKHFRNKYYQVAFTALVSAFLTQNRHKLEVLSLGRSITLAFDATHFVRPQSIKNGRQ